MTDLRTANIVALGPLVAIRDLIASVGVPAVQHAATFDPLHKHRGMVDDFILVARAWLNRFNEAINDLDPNATPATLDAPPPPSFGGVMLTENELEALRTHRIGQVVAHAKLLADARFTPDERIRYQALWSQSLAGQSDAAQPLTDEETADLNELEADSQWATARQNEAWARVDDLLAADQATLQAYDVTEGWPP